jgi:hypothetical protein
MTGLSTSALAYDTSKQADLAAAMHSSDDRRAFAWDGSHVVIARPTGAAQLATHPLRLNSDTCASSTRRRSVACVIPANTEHTASHVIVPQGLPQEKLF